MGTNNLDSGVTPHKVVRDLHALACRLQATYNIMYVFIEQIINRDTVLYPACQQRAEEANALLQDLIIRAQTIISGSGSIIILQKPSIGYCVMTEST